MKKSFTWALATMALLTVLTGCKKEDEDEISSGDVNKGAFLVSDNEKDYYVVDMGGAPLTKLWATCNIGATNCKEYGEYFAWGETEAKNDYDWPTYAHCNNGNRLKINKYSSVATNTYNNTPDNITKLEDIDDVATQRYGSKWSIPTRDDFQQLINRCDWKCGHVDGVWGYLFTSRENGNTIFFPLAGVRDLESLLHSGAYGFYWSKELHNRLVDENTSNNNASTLELKKPTNPVCSTYEERYIGLPIRPVRKR